MGRAFKPTELGPCQYLYTTGKIVAKINFSEFSKITSFQPVSSTVFFTENQMISSCDDKTVRLFDFRTMNELERLSTDSSVNKLDILCGSSHVALPHDDGNIRLVKMCQGGNSRLRRIRHRQKHHHPGCGRQNAD